MSEVLSKTLHGDFDSVFFEVNQSEKVSWTTEGQSILAVPQNESGKSTLSITLSVIDRAYNSKNFFIS